LNIIVTKLRGTENEVRADRLAADGTVMLPHVDTNIALCIHFRYDKKY